MPSGGGRRRTAHQVLPACSRTVRLVVTFTVVEGRITVIAVVTDPAELALMDLPTQVRSSPESRLS